MGDAATSNVFTALSQGLGGMAALQVKRQSDREEHEWEAYLKGLELQNQQTIEGKRFEHDQAIEASREQSSKDILTAEQDYNRPFKEKDQQLEGQRITDARLAAMREQGQSAITEVDRQIAHLQELKLKGSGVSGLGGEDEASVGILGMPGQVDPAKVDEVIKQLTVQRRTLMVENARMLAKAGDPYFAGKNDDQLMASLGFVEKPKPVAGARPGDTGPPLSMAPGNVADKLAARGAQPQPTSPGEDILPAAQAAPTEQAPQGDLLEPAPFSTKMAPPQEAPGLKPLTDAAGKLGIGMYNRQLATTALEQARGAAGKVTLGSSLDKLREFTATMDDMGLQRWLSQNGFTHDDYEKIRKAIGR